LEVIAADKTLPGSLVEIPKGFQAGVRSMGLAAFLDVVGGVLGLAAIAVTILVSIDKLWSLHLARARRQDDQLSADAAEAVAAVHGSYVQPLRREKLARILGSAAPPAHPLHPQHPDETQRLARLYTCWALALKLTDGEAHAAFEQAVDLLAEDYPDRAESELRGKVRRAFQHAKTGMPGTLHQISTFISRCRQSSPTPL